MLSQIKAIYLAIQKERINYVTTPKSFEQSGQRIRLIDEVLKNKMGNCLETTLLFASCLESVGLHGLVLVLEGHAFVGCWLEERTFYDSMSDEISEITKRLFDGINEIEVLETTLLTSSDNVPFELSTANARNQLKNTEKFHYVLDVQKNRELGIKPLPQKNAMSDPLNIKKVDDQSSPIDETFLEPQNKISDLEIEVATKRKRSRLKNWESKLLNLTLRNNLLNFRPVKQSISLMESGLGDIENLLSSGQELSLVPCPAEFSSENRKDGDYSYTRNGSELQKSFAHKELKSKRLVSLMNSKDLEYAIKALHYNSRVDIEENGANTLFLSIGFLKWFETEASLQPRYAPILLYPVELIRKSSIKGYVIRFRDEEIQLNTTLLEKLRMDLNLEIPSLDVLPVDESGIDVEKVLGSFQKAILNKKGWEVVSSGYIGLFSFNQFVMWNDIKNRSDELTNNPIISSLISGSLEVEGPSIIESKVIDNSDFTSGSAILLPADSSQLSAVHSAASGSSFVLHGPPGTGKSQTITNIIATALYQGKSVLFVAEKMAALNVVRERLVNIGLGDFALELHSNKAKKSEVLTNIGKTLDLKRNGSIKDIKEKKEQLIVLRDEIKESNEALHRNQINGFSAFEMIEMYENQMDVDIYRVENFDGSTITQSFIDDIKDSAKRYSISFEQNGDINNHPLKPIRITQLGLKERDDILNELKKLENITSILTKKIKDSFIGESGLSQSFGEVKQYLKFLTLVCSTNHIFIHFVTNFKTEEIDNNIFNIIKNGQRRADIKDIIEKDFSSDVFDIDSKRLLIEWNSSQNKWIVPKILGERKLYTQLKYFSNNPKLFSKSSVREVLEILQEDADLKRKNINFMEVFGNKYNELWHGELTNWDDFEDGVRNTKEIISYLLDFSVKYKWLDVNYIIESVVISYKLFTVSHRSSITSLNETLIHFINNVKSVNKLIKGNLYLDKPSLSTSIKVFLDILENYQLIDRWVEHNSNTTHLVEKGFGKTIEAIAEGLLNIENLEKSIIKSLMYQSILEFISAEESLNNFNSSGFEVLMERYKNELSTTTEMTRLELIERLIQELPSPNGSVNINSEIGILKKAVSSKGRGISLRSVFEQTPNVIRRVAPCMLMSPISIAQYIDPKHPPFDLVVFDEASQVYTHMAVGAIARGKSLIVVGDPKQLPPTSFFSGSNNDDDESFEEIDQDSILDECLATSFPELHLNWHYRSRHESLIAFSNNEYYCNSLFTFPSFNDMESKVKLVQLDGFYDRGRTKENIVEAEHIISEVQRRLSSSSLHTQTIGIVTFSSIQQRLISTLLDEMYVKYPDLEEVANTMREPIFVKNLENVQGDERDVILFSIGYGPDKEGKVSLNFGPLNHQQGWKRLNVVVTRSREEMIVYSTLKPEQIDLNRTSAKGVHGLKYFLEFARNKNSLAISTSSSAISRDGVTESIARELSNMGITVHTNVGKSNFRIDIGVISEHNPEEYIAAIIVDGLSSKSTPTVRDRVVVQPSVLNGLGWATINVWTLDWFRNKQIILDEIKIELEKLSSQAKESLVKVVEEKSGLPEIEYEIVEKPQVVFYERLELDQNQFNKDLFYEYQALPYISKYIEEIVNFESPVIQDDVFRRVSRVYGINQIGSRVREILENAVSTSNVYSVISDVETELWVSIDDYENYRTCRYYKDTKREFEHIGLTEIQNTVIEVLRNSISIDEENLIREVFKIHGFNMLGEKNQSKVRIAVYTLLDESRIIEESGRYLVM